MSIHHSKGLEFPVVFVAGMGKSFNKQEGREKAVFHNHYGIGLDYVDLEHRMKRPTLLKQFIRRQNLRDSLGEELRVLYVAMTRAKEKLILTGMGKEKLLSEEGTSSKEKLPYLRLMAAECSMAWVLSGRNKKGSTMKKVRVPLAVIVEHAVQAQLKDVLTRDEMEKMILFRSREENLYKQVEAKLSWEYLWDLGGKTKQKYTVTELKKQRMQEETEYGEDLYPQTEPVPVLPQFVEKTKEKTGAARGTLYHRMMECMDWDKVAEKQTLQAVKEEMARLESFGKLTKEEKKSIRPSDFLTFARSDLAKRMQKAKERGQLYREQPFVIGVPGTEVDGTDQEELVLIQGIIDVYFYEGDEVVVVDYKTDRVSQEEELRERYRMQLSYYERALEMVTGKKVKERLLYSFALGKEVEI